MKTYGKCELSTCRYNANKQCTNKANRKKCLEMCEAVLSDEYRVYLKERMESEWVTANTTI